jgi:hypothetical protein
MAWMVRLVVQMLRISLSTSGQDLLGMRGIASAEVVAIAESSRCSEKSKHDECNLRRSEM